MYCKTQIKSYSKEMISENKKLSLCSNCESKVLLSCKNKIELWEEKATLIEQFAYLSGEPSTERLPEVIKMKKKWCGKCPMWRKSAWTMLSCKGPCPEEVYVDGGD